MRMTGIPRNQIIYDGCLFHVAWRCHNKTWLLRDEGIKRLYYDLLLKYRDKYEMIFYGYHFMENHVHLIGEMKSVELFSDFFRLVNNLFARQTNRRMRRRGQVVMERIKSLPIETDDHLLSVMAYADLNGVRAGRDKTPEDSVWSSYNYYAHGKKDDLLTPAPSYLALSDNPVQRQIQYRTIVNDILASSPLSKRS
jgi:putative transposase